MGWETCLSSPLLPSPLRKSWNPLFSTRINFLFPSSFAPLLFCQHGLILSRTFHFETLSTPCVDNTTPPPPSPSDLRCDQFKLSRAIFTLYAVSKRKLFQFQWKLLIRQKKYNFPGGICIPYTRIIYRLMLPLCPSL